MKLSIHLGRLGLATIFAAFNFSAPLYAETAAVACDATMMAMYQTFNAELKAVVEN